MSIQIVINRNISTRSEIPAHVAWITDRVPSGEFNVINAHTEDDAGNLIQLDTTVTIWSDDCERVAMEYYKILGCVQQTLYILIHNQPRKKASCYI
jgi:hypothetical protein